MKTFIFTYETTFKNGIFKEEYSIQSDSQSGAEYCMSFGAGDLITKHAGIGRSQSMKLISIEEK